MTRPGIQWMLADGELEDCLDHLVGNHEPFTVGNPDRVVVLGNWQVVVTLAKVWEHSLREDWTIKTLHRYTPDSIFWDRGSYTFYADNKADQRSLIRAELRSYITKLLLGVDTPGPIYASDVPPGPYLER